MKTKLRLIREIRNAYNAGFIFGWDSDDGTITLHIDPSIKFDVVDRLRKYLLGAFDVASIDHNQHYSENHRQSYSVLDIHTK